MYRMFMDKVKEELKVKVELKNTKNIKKDRDN